jgi:putative hydrolase of the HAD superfamily
MDPPGPALREELAARGVEVSADQAAAAFRAEISYYLEHQLEGRDAASLDELRDRCADVLREAVGVPGLDRATARGAMLAAIRFRPFEDAAPALAELRGRGLRLAVASNWDWSLPDVLRDAGLLELLDAVVSSAEAGVRKPDARLFALALERVGARPEHAVHVGDSPANDVAGAAAAGIRAVLLRRDRGRPDEVAEDAVNTAPAAAAITTLADLPRVL